jgi:hypothetical protein
MQYIDRSNSNQDQKPIGKIVFQFDFHSFVINCVYPQALGGFYTMQYKGASEDVGNMENVAGAVSVARA